MSFKGHKMQALQDMREAAAERVRQLERDLERQKFFLAGIDASIQALSGQQDEGQVEASVGRVNVKPYVMDAILEYGEKGITAVEIVEFAAQKGVAIKQPSVSSLLSRMKADNTLKFLNERYYPVKGGSVTASDPQIVHRRRYGPSDVSIRPGSENLILERVG